MRLAALLIGASLGLSACVNPRVEAKATAEAEQIALEALAEREAEEAQQQQPGFESAPIEEPEEAAEPEV